MQGMLDAQLARLADVLRLGRIWAANVGENFDVSQDAWQDFARALPATAVAHLFVEEGNLVGTDLKKLVRGPDKPRTVRGCTSQSAQGAGGPLCPPDA